MSTPQTPTALGLPDLAKLSDDGELFRELSEGLSHVHAHVAELERNVLGAAEAKLARAVRVLTVLLRDEAGKYLILLDAARCPRDRLQTHLDKCRRETHVARSIYADVCEWRVGTFGELHGHAERDLRRFYLDGPNDVDWIFPNSLNTEREQALYVDYYRTDDGGHFWHSPLKEDELFGGLVHVPRAVALVKALHAAGVGAPQSLAHVARVWRGVAVYDEMDHGELYRLNRQTLVTLDENGTLADCAQEVYEEIMDSWPFPLHSLDLKLRRVDLNDLHQERASWCPDPGFYGEYDDYGGYE